MGFLKWKDWAGGALNVFKETPASDIGEGLIRHEWQGDKYNVQQIGTTLKAEIMNNLQMGLNFLVDSNHTVVNSEDHYTVAIDGLKTTTSNSDGYELTENLHFSIKTTEENINGVSKLIINGDSYDLQKKEEGTVVELNQLDLKADKVYSVYFDGAGFIIDSSSLQATEKTAGIITLEQIKSEIENSFELKASIPGYEKRPNGIMEQWFLAQALSSNGEAGTIVNFPYPYENSVLDIRGGDGGSGAHSVGIRILSKTQCIVWGKLPGTTGYIDTTVRIFVKGY
ncbi:Uncharacterised protein [Sebaldella termitidis]|uniref:Uncharacterized protein n=1 Tax=Sebaldella termitidis (strain ATCC 33386 / NCTC 11300) TaxID=526218 RepID=D1AR60_SEBTE|nr:hypothetical protein [Sebaldella termitidis]ACZ07748.1 hypothetical protein Sterm_0876 [Sebaldella termitidis ATCC 33386]SUI23045.1 Uncharacterised protein [Sebaldella termitidis]